MFKILKKKILSKDVFQFEIEALQIAKKACAGQFVIVMAHEDGERIPLTIYDYDKDKGLLWLIYQVIGASTEELSHAKDEIFSVVGPLGNGNEICANPGDFKEKRICT